MDFCRRRGRFRSFFGIVNADSGRYEECVPGLGLSEQFGFQVIGYHSGRAFGSSYQMGAVRDCETAETTIRNDRLFCYVKGLIADFAIQNQSLVCTLARFPNEKPAVIERTIGRSRAICFAVSVAQAYQKNPKENGAFLNEICRLPSKSVLPRVRIRTASDRSHRLIFVDNASEQIFAVPKSWEDVFSVAKSSNLSAGQLCCFSGKCPW